MSGPVRAVPRAVRRGVGLVRVSKARGREDLISPELQRTAIEDYARRSGIAIVDWREALDESGSQDRSPWWATFDEVIAAVEAGAIEVVLVWKYSRAARHRRRWAIAIDRIEVAGGQLESATEGLDTSTSTGRLGRGMLAEIASWEAERMGEQWKETHARRAANGLPHTGRARFGYLYSRDTGYTPDPETAPVLVAMYERFAAGESVRSIARWLNVNGVLTTRGGPWAANTVYRLLDAGFGAGFLHERRDGGRLLPGAHEPVISPDLWERFGRMRAQGRKAAPWSRHPSHSLSGLVRCGECGGGMSVNSVPGRNGVTRRQYRCGGRSVGLLCPGTHIEVHLAEEAVLDWLRTIHDDLDVAARAAAARVTASRDVRADRTVLTRRLARLERQLVQLNLDRADGLMPDAVAFVTARDEITAARDEAREALEAVSVDAEVLGRSHRPVVSGLLRDWAVLSVQDRRDALRTLVRRVVVNRTGSGEPRVRVVPIWEAAREVS